MKLNPIASSETYPLVAINQTRISYTISIPSGVNRQNFPHLFLTYYFFKFIIDITVLF